MGIKFRCPNGHKLNVKSFLAGRRGVCPDCQATFRIPEEPGGSDVRATPLPSLKGGNGTAAPDSPGEPAMSTAAVATAPVIAAPAVSVLKAAAPVVTPVAPVTALQPVAAMAPAMTVGPGIPLATGAAVLPTSNLATVAAPAAPAAGDPIAEAPAAVWYVRPPSGGQYGPARGDVLRKWISEGRVSGDSLVWREGWSDWRSAGQLFSALGGPSALAAPAAVGSTSAGPMIAGPAVAAPVAVPSSPRSTSRYAARKKSGNGMAIAALVGLVLVCVVLVAVLVVVLAQQSA